MGFVHLHLHTQYSLLDGANKIVELMPKLARQGMSAAAMTDHGNMFGTVDFYTAAERQGVQPIIGCEVYVAPRSRLEKTGAKSDDFERAGNYHLILLASTLKGYRNLSRLVSQSYKDGFYYKPRIDKELLTEFNEGLICLSGCLGGEVANAIMNDREDRARATVEWYSKLFGDRYYLEIQDNHLAEQKKVNDVLIPMSKDVGIPLVATNDCHYLDHADHMAHEVLLCVQTGKSLNDPNRWKFGTDQLYVKDDESIRRGFPEIESAVDCTMEIAKRCELELEFGNHKFPVYQTPPNVSIDEMFEREARDGLVDRLLELKKLGQEVDEEAYRERLEIEINTIREMQFPGYFLIVSDFINWAKEQGIPVGPGRGSAAGSLVSWAMRITDLDPIPYNLLFERFLNPERVSMPDIDVDFCYERRDEVVQYVRRKYGEDNVANIITFGTLKAKAALRDVGRALDFTFAETDRICKLYPEAKQGKEFKLAAALEMEPRLREIRDSGDREAQLFEYAQRLEGLARHVSKHAAGIVISDRPLVEDCPLFVDKDGTVMTQFAGPDVEAIGLIKFDFLGLKTLTLIADTLRRVEETENKSIDLAALPLDDEASYKLMQHADTIGVFQMESGGMRKLLTQIKPNCFEDIVAVLALFRPGPLDSGMVEQYIQRKHGREVVRYPDPILEPILRETYGVIVYQEQVMQIAQVYGGYSLGQADNLRRAMGKKKAEAMAAEKERFLAGAAEREHKAAAAEAIFQQMETFAAYGFNKSHSAAYALVTYHTAYLKAHHPREFLAALLTMEMGSADNTYKNLADCREHGIAVLPPDINTSRSDFTVVPEGIRFGLGAVKGVGEKAIESIIEARTADGPFTSLGDFCLRAGGGQVSKRITESLIKAGAMTRLHPSRARLLAGVEGATAWATRVADDKAAGQMGLFAGGGKDSDGIEPEEDLPTVRNWDMLEELRFEHESVGFYISGHPLDRYESDLDLLGTLVTSGLAEQRDQDKVRLAGVINALKRKNSKKGDRYATFTLEDREGGIEVIAWPETYRKCETAILSQDAVMVSGKIEQGFGGGARGSEDANDFAKKAQIIADEVIPITEARRQNAAAVSFKVCSGTFDPEKLQRLQSALAQHPGTCRPFLFVQRASDTDTMIELPADLAVDPTDHFLDAVVELVGEGNVVLERSIPSAT